MRTPRITDCWRAVLCIALLAAVPGVRAQTPADFADLARRGVDLVDSNPAEAANLLKQALAIRPDWPEGWLYLGASFYAADRFAEATDAFRKGTRLSPKSGNAWAFLGLCEAELDDPDQAIADIRKGETLGLGENPQFEVAVRVKAAQMLILNSAFDEALAQLAQLAQHNENSPAIEETMGLCAMAIPESLASLPAGKRAIVALAGKAAWASASQRPTEAAAAYKELLQRYPEEPGVHYAYGLYLMETDLVAAMAEFQQDVKGNPKHWPALILVGGMYGRQGSPEQAISTLNQAMANAPVRYRWICHAERGRAEMTAGQLDAAIADFETAVRLMPSNPQAHFYLSQAYRRAGRKTDAQREVEAFEKLKVQQDPLGVPALRPFTFSGSGN